MGRIFYGLFLVIGTSWKKSHQQGMTIDQVVHFDTQPVDVTILDKPNFEQINLNLINQLDEDDRTVVFKIIDTMLTKKKFKDFFNNNVAAL